MNAARIALIPLIALGVTMVAVSMHLTASPLKRKRGPDGQRLMVRPRAAPPSVPQKPAPLKLTDLQQRTLDSLMRGDDDWRSLMSEPEFSKLFGSAWQRLIVDPAWQHEFKSPAVLIRQFLGEPNATRENTLVQFDFNRIFDSKDDLREFAATLVAGDQQAMGEMLTRHLWVIASEQYFSDDPITDRGMSTLARPDHWPPNKAKQQMPADSLKTEEAP